MPCLLLQAGQQGVIDDSIRQYIRSHEQRASEGTAAHDPAAERQADDSEAYTTQYRPTAVEVAEAAAAAVTAAADEGEQ